VAWAGASCDGIGAGTCGGIETGEAGAGIAGSVGNGVWDETLGCTAGATLVAPSSCAGDKLVPERPSPWVFCMVVM
jgi:hypothetical protein